MASNHILVKKSGVAFMLFILFSCSEQPKETMPINTPVPVSNTAANLPPEDPTFVLSKDTVSAQGPASITRNVLQDKNGNLWIASWEGLIRYDGKQFTNITLKEGLRHFHVFALFEDQRGNLWFGTIGGGLYRYDGRSFTNFTKADGLINNAILCLQEDQAGNIWIGTQEGVSRYDGASFTNFTTENGLANNFVSAIARDKNGKLWFGTNSGVSCYEPLNGGSSFTAFKNEKGASFYLVRAITEDKSGNIWIGSADGLCRYDGKSLNVLTTISTSCITEDQNGNLWLSQSKPNSSDMLLTKYDGKSFGNIRMEKQVFGSIADEKGNIWFGTANGVRRYDGKAFSSF